LGIYNAIENPSLGSAIGGASGAVNLANTGSNLASGSALNAPATGALGTAGSALGAAGAGLGLYNALQNPSNPLNDVQGALDAYKLYGAGSSLLGGGAGAGLAAANTALAAGDLSGAAAGIGANAAATGAADTGASLAGGASLGAAAGPVAALAAIVLQNQISAADPRNTPDSFNPNAAASGLRVDPYGKLTGGNDILSGGNIGVGAGTDETRGSGQIYQVNPKTGQYTWIGQGDSNQLEQDYENYSLSAGAPALTNTGITGNIGTVTRNADGTYSAPNSTIKSGLGAQTLAMQNALANMNSIFSNTGGQGYWGTDQSDWDAETLKLLGNVEPGTYWAGKNQGYGGG
jgi:hypothetical protein